MKWSGDNLRDLRSTLWKAWEKTLTWSATFVVVIAVIAYFFAEDKTRIVSSVAPVMPVLIGVFFTLFAVLFIILLFVDLTAKWVPRKRYPCWVCLSLAQLLAGYLIIYDPNTILWGCISREATGGLVMLLLVVIAVVFVASEEKPQPVQTTHGLDTTGGDSGTEHSERLKIVAWAALLGWILFCLLTRKGKGR